MMPSLLSLKMVNSNEEKPLLPRSLVLSSRKLGTLQMIIVSCPNGCRTARIMLMTHHQGYINSSCHSVECMNLLSLQFVWWKDFQEENELHWISEEGEGEQGESEQKSNSFGTEWETDWTDFRLGLRKELYFLLDITLFCCDTIFIVNKGKKLHCSERKKNIGLCTLVAMIFKYL